MDTPRAELSHALDGWVPVTAMTRSDIPGSDGTSRRGALSTEEDAHVRDQRRLLDALEASGLASDFWALCEHYAVRLIAPRVLGVRSPSLTSRS